LKNLVLTSALIAFISFVTSAACSSSSSTPTSTQTPVSRAVTDFLAGVTSDAGGTGTQQAGTPPAPSGGPTLTAPPSGSASPGGVIDATLQSASPFQTVYLSVGGTSATVGGYYQLVLPSPTTSTRVKVTLAGNVAENAFDAVYRVASPTGAVGATASARTTVDPQTCALTVTPTTASVAATGGSVQVTVSVTRGSGCGWTAASNSSFISIASGSSGIGSGTVTISVPVNTGAARSGTATIAGQTLTVNQNSIGNLITPAACGSQTRSTEGTTPTTIIFFNARSTAVRTFWLDYNGVRQPYSVIDPGASATQPTFLTHPWIATDLAGSCLATYLPLAQTATAIIQ
jgi:hypothetical protein